MNRKDNLTVKRIATLHPKLRAEAAEIYAEICKALTGRAICRFSHTHRTFQEQNALYDQGRKTPGPGASKTKPLGSKVTNAKAGQSYHNYGMAVDIVLLVDKDGNGTFETASWETNVDFDGDGKADWMEVAAIFKRYGWTWGGDWQFQDKPHFEKTFGKSVKELESLHLLKQVDATGYVIL